MKISPMNSRDGSSSWLQTIETCQPAPLPPLKILMFRILRFFQLGALAVAMGAVMGSRAAEQKDTPDTALFVKLVDAARLGDVGGVNRALDEGADINRVDGWPTPRPGTPKPVQRTALFHAMQAGRPETAAVLIERGVNLVAAMDGQTPLGWAGTFGDKDSLLRIWARLTEAERAELLRKNESWEGGLEYGQLDAVKELERLGFSLRGTDGGTRALSLAVASGRLECVDHVLALNLPSLDRPWNGVTALARAAGQGDVAIMQRL
ncbi:MAG TPA: ankyrin repeat domain-containing protein, partial [Rariglobus sp.]